ncbi:helix-turn-helix domain-containing protein [Actinoallomurus sp. CA-142502]|uniref:helix-turn-helix domain-containing protein n=1 Tax=Actinoallomurus sp. CA-142502 TaxID=3239885 RepID=UPI003D8EE46A
MGTRRDPHRARDARRPPPLPPTDITAKLESAGSPDPQRNARDAVRLYEQGWSIRRVAEEFGVSYGAMRRLLMNNTELRSRGWNENR